MRIDLQFGNLQSVEAQKTNSARAAGAERLKHAERKDKAEISSTSLDVAALDRRAMAEPDVRADRVNELRASIADGSYSVEPQAIADAMARDIF